MVGSKKGRGKTTDADGKTSVGGVAPAVAERAKNKGGPQPFADFYRFQRREKQRGDVLELREKFAADKRRIQELREARRFKPY